jgi:hypothetical protein
MPVTCTNQSVKRQKTGAVQFVLVNDRMPRGRVACAFCRKPLELGYLRVISSSQIYCSYQCCDLHCKAANVGGDRSGLDPWSNAIPTGLSGLYVAPHDRQSLNPWHQPTATVVASLHKSDGLKEK